MSAPTVTRAGTGWLVACGCGFERHCERRPVADRVVADHACRTPKQPKSAAKPRPRADWTTREDSTWIDKL